MFAILHGPQHDFQQIESVEELTPYLGRIVVVCDNPYFAPASFHRAFAFRINGFASGFMYIPEKPTDAFEGGLGFSCSSLIKKDYPGLPTVVNPLTLDTFGPLFIRQATPYELGKIALATKGNVAHFPTTYCEEASARSSDILNR